MNRNIVLKYIFCKYILILFACVMPLMGLFYSMLFLVHEPKKLAPYFISSFLSIFVSILFLRGGKVQKYIFISYLLILALGNFLVSVIFIYNKNVQGIFMFLFGLYLIVGSFYALKKY